MPIRLNLLAEVQAAEDLRRRDPVKRAIFVGAALVSLMVVWSLSLQVRAMVSKSGIAGLEQRMSDLKHEFQGVLDSKKKYDDYRRKLDSLHRLATNRFLNGNLLNALMQTTMEDVQLTHLKTEHRYALTEGTKPKTNGTVVVPGRPATATERISITLDARDSSYNAGDQVNKFKENISKNSYFEALLGKGNSGGATLGPVSPPKRVGNEPPYVEFTVDCKLPEKTR